MTHTVFYAWQSDRPDDVCRNLIRGALDDAAGMLRKELGVDIRIDQDTQDVPGSPSIPDTILTKIAGSAALVADLTLTHSSVKDREKRGSNPNVMLEYGYALAKLGPDKLVGVANEAFGPVESLSFDIRHRKAVTYRADGESDLAASGKQLAEKLTAELRPILRFEPADRPPPWNVDLIDEDTEKPVTLAPGPALYLNCEPYDEEPQIELPSDMRRNLACGLLPLAPPDLLPEDAARLRRLRAAGNIGTFGTFLPDPAVPERAVAASLVTQQGSFHGVWCGCAESPAAGLGRRLDEDRLAETLVAGLKCFHSAFEGAGLLPDIHFSARCSEVRVRLDGVRDLPLMMTGGSLAGPLLVEYVEESDEAPMLWNFYHALREAAGEDGEAALPRSLRSLSTWPARRVRF